MILVTGATGLVGSHLVLHLLEQNQAVKALFRNENGKQKVKTVFAHYNKQYLFERIIWCQADILDVTNLEIAFQEVTKVYHCSALISFDPSDEEKLRKVNIEGTANIVNLCLDFEIKKLCYVSSTSALGDLLPHEKIVTEETEWNPEISHTDYAISKYGAEMEVWRAQQEGLNVVVINPGVILGPFFWIEGSGEIYQKVKNGLKFYTKGITGYIVLDDVVEILIQLMESEITNEKFILVSENKSYQEVLFAIADVLHVKKPAFYANAILTAFVWKIDWFFNVFFGKKRSLSKNLANTLHSEDFYLNDKICKTLNFKFQSISNYLKTINP